MECTQRLECTQELYDTLTERTCPEQIGFLGICGAKHPVLKGPNKIGRDPQTCNIVLNLNSVSRQHAVINVLNSREFMLMDLDSANKTKLQNKTLQPYIPHRLKDGDTVQFGDLFGIFRLLEEDDALPMTQALDIPDTPVPSKPVSKLHKAPTTLIPESPDVSDRDDSFITPTQPKGGKYKLSKSPFMKPFGKPMSALSPSSPKIDSNRNSSKRSTSLSFIENPNTSLNESFISLKSDKKVANNIFEMDTQVPNPVTNKSTDSIYTADTQISPERAPSIHSLDTQLPTTDHLPQVQKIHDQHEMQLDIYAANKENNQDNIFDAETQQFENDRNESTEIINNNKSNLSNEALPECAIKDKSKEKLNTSEEELLFDEVNEECFEDFYSQNLLPDELPFKEDKIKKINMEENNPIPSKRDVRIKSDGSTDCEDIDMLPTQKIPALPTKENEKQGKVEEKIDQARCSKRTARTKSDSSTDCEDIDIARAQNTPELPIKNKTLQQNEKDDVKSNIKPIERLNRIESDSSTDCEDIDMAPTQKIPELPIKNKTVQQNDNDGANSNKKPLQRFNRIKSDSSTDCEDIDIIPTQNTAEKVIDKDDDVTDCEDEVVDSKTNQSNQPSKNKGFTKFEDMPTQIIDVDYYKNDKLAFEDMPTQVIDVIDVATYSKNVPFEDQATQIIESDDVIIVNNHERVKKSFNEIVSPFKIPLQSPIKVKSKDIPKLTPKKNSTKSKPTDLDDNYYNATQDIYDDLCSQRESSPDILINAPSADDEVVPCSVEDYKVGEKFAGIDRELCPNKKQDNEKIETFVSNLSTQEVRDIIGINEKFSKLKRVPSDSSDVEQTPKKLQPFDFTDSDLPNSQEIKTSVMCHTKTAVTDSSSESETENFSEDQTPFLHRKKKIKPVVKIDLTKKFDPHNLPDRVLTRQRKPPSKLIDSTAVGNKLLISNILKSSYLVEQEDQVDGEIITENIKRIKTYHEAKSHKDSKNNESVKEVKKEITSRKKTENKQNEQKEKIKVKIEKPKRKDTKSKSESSSRKSNESDKNKAKADNSETTSVAAVTTRITRARKNENDSKNSSKQSVSPENNKKEPENNNKRKRANKVREKSKSPEIEVRRSRRQLKAKEKSGEETMNAPKSILKKSMHEQSTVYDISTSSADSSRGLKRSLVNDSDVCSPKRTRSSANSSNNNITNASLRATPSRVMTQHVLFTAFPSEDVKLKLERLGAVVVTDVLSCSVVLTIQVKRTFKLLCAVGLGRPIVGPGWVQACADTHMIVDPWLYLIKDEAAEKRFQFNLERTLKGQRNFLKGYHVSSTPSVQPNASEMKLIVESSGGVWKEAGPNWVCVSCTKDKALWPALRKRGATIVSTEFILAGVLRQKLDLASTAFH